MSLLQSILLSQWFIYRNKYSEQMLKNKKINDSFYKVYI